MPSITIVITDTIRLRDQCRMLNRRTSVRKSQRVVGFASTPARAAAGEWFESFAWERSVIVTPFDTIT